jgi:hypothetical protein
VLALYLRKHLLPKHRIVGDVRLLLDLGFAHATRGFFNPPGVKFAGVSRKEERCNDEPVFVVLDDLESFLSVEGFWHRLR